MDGTSGGEDAAFQKGQQVGQYQIVEILTPTRFGHIYLGRHLYQPIQVLIEGLLPPLLDGATEENFLKGTQALKELEHPHILRIRDADIHQSYPFLVTEYLLYRTFNQVYAPKSIQPLKTILPHLKKIAEALHYAHGRYVLHGDIRPENILLDTSDAILLRGFLLEAVVQNRGHLNYRGREVAEHDAIVYAAPERIQGNSGFASDQYALGVLVYELLCGKAPFTGSSVEIAFQKVHSPAPALQRKAPDLVPPSVEQVVMRALEKEPEKRFPDVQAFIDALEQEQKQLPADLSTTSVATPDLPTGTITPAIVAPAPAPYPAPRGFLGPEPASPSPALAPLATMPQMSAPPALQHDPQARIMLPTSLSTVSTPAPPAPALKQEVHRPVKKARVQSPPPAKPPARRQGGTSVTRRIFSLGLISVAALGGAGGWYLLSQRFAHTALSAVSATSKTPPPATRTTINNQNALIFTGHLAGVNAVTWSPDGKFIASASDDTFVQIFEAATGKRSLIYRGHAEEVAAVAWSPDGRWIASGGQDQTIQLWNAASGAPLFTYRGHRDRVNGISWSSDSTLLVSGSDDESVQAWQANNGAPYFTFLGHTAGVLCVGWQPDNTSVASGSWDGTLRDWATVQHGDHFNAGDQIFDYSGHGNSEVYALDWSPDSNFIVSAGADQTVQISNGVDGTPRPPFFTDHRRKDHTNRVFTVAWSPDGASIASGDEDGNVYVWHTAGRQTYFRYTGHKGAINAVAWSPDGKFIASASADNTVHVWQPA